MQKGGIMQVSTIEMNRYALTEHVFIWLSRLLAKQAVSHLQMGQLIKL